MASSKEFIKFKNQLIVNNSEERSKFYKDVWYLLHNEPWLAWRYTKIKKMMNGEFDNYNQKRIVKLLHISQFNNIELKQKGNFEVDNSF